jgi:hypothetical protein
MTIFIILVAAVAISLIGITISIMNGTELDPDDENF